jgi:hypothetical protein
LNRRELALLRYLEDSVSRILDIELKADRMVSLAKQVEAAIEVSNKVFGQSQMRLFSFGVRESSASAASVFKPGACPKAAVTLAPFQTRDSSMYLVESGPFGRRLHCVAAGTQPNKSPTERTLQGTDYLILNVFLW